MSSQPFRYWIETDLGIILLLLLIEPSLYTGIHLTGTGLTIIVLLFFILTLLTLPGDLYSMGKKLEPEQKELSITKMVYICHPLSKPTIADNKKKVLKICVNISENCKEKILPFAPHLYFLDFLDDHNEEDRKLGLLYDRKLIDVCDEMWVYGQKRSEGMKEEIEYAIKIEKKVIYLTDHQSFPQNEVSHRDERTQSTP